MRFPFHQNRFEPALKQVPNPLVTAVKTLSVDSVELAHADGEIGLRCFNQQMIMIRHQTVGVADPTVTTDNPG